MTDHIDHILAALQEANPELAAKIRRGELPSEPDPCLLEHATPTIIAAGWQLRAVVPSEFCVRCNNTRWIVQEGTQRGTCARPCPGARLARAATLFDAAQLPSGPLVGDEGRPVYLDATLDQARLRRRVLEGFDPGSKGMWLWGEQGRGKSWTLVAVVRHLTLDRSIRCRWVEMPQLLDAIRATYDEDRGKRTRNEQAIVDDLASVPVLVLDDVGRMNSGGAFEGRILEAIVRRRYRTAGLSTFVTSNRSPDQIAALEADGWSVRATVSRLAEMTGPLHWTGRDRRQRQGGREI